MSWIIHDPLTRFLVQVVVIISACRGLGLIARRVGQPVVIAEIAAGIVLGPSVLGWLSPATEEALFPVGSLGVVRMLSQLGLLLFMLLVGLELDVRLLRGQARTSIAVSQVSIVVPFTLGCVLAIHFRAALAPDGVDELAFALFMGAAMSITAFPVLARILTERRLLRTRVGTVGVACAAVDDVTAWCILAFAVSIARARGMAGAVLTTSVAFAYVGAMLLVVRPLLARLAARVTTPGAMSQNLVALVLLLVLVSSWVTERIGIHMLFGAFLFGVVLPKEGGFARALAEKLEDVVVVLLLPLFFALSGLRTQISLVTSPEHLVITGAIIVAATLGKFGGATIAARVCGLSWRESGALGVLMNTRGLMELIVLNIGLDLGIVSPTLFSMMVIMALVTTFVATPLLHWFYPPSAMAHDLVDAEAPRAAHPTSFRALVCISHGRSGPGLVSIANALVGATGDVVALHLSTTTDRGSSRVGDGPDDVEDILAPAVTHARALGMTVRPLSFVSTDPGEDIARVADVRDVDVAVLGLHKPVLSRSLLGGVVHDVLQRADATVAIFVDRDGGAIGRVLVPFHGSPHDRAALALAARVRDSMGAEITILHVVTPGRDPARSRKLVEAFVAESGPATIETVEHDSPADVAIARARDFQLVVVGVGAEWGLGEKRLGLGLQPERLIRDSSASLLIVRSGRADLRDPTPRRPLATARVNSE